MSAVQPLKLGAKKPATPMYPPGFKEFVDRCNSKAMKRSFSKVQVDTMKYQMKTLIERAFASQKQFTNNWFKQDLPIFNSKLPLELVCDLSAHQAAPPPPSGVPPPPNGVPPPPPPPGRPLPAPLPPVARSGGVIGKTGVIKAPQKQDKAPNPLGKAHSPQITTHSPQVRPYTPQVQSPVQAQKKRPIDDNEEMRRKRAERFQTTRVISPIVEDYRNLNSLQSSYAYYDKNKPIVGQCTTLEKSYLRLTSEPDPLKVRPLDVLRKAFKLVVSKYKDGSTYAYLCDQLKSIRQDLRVQIIENKFTVKVYETHAIFAIENNDMGEFNQCQTILKTLYEKVDAVNAEEFLSYRILYYVMTKNYDLINQIRLQNPQSERCQTSLKFARFSLNGNYHQLFKLFGEATGTTKQLMQSFISNERLKALSMICASYNQLDLGFLISEFHFHDQEDCLTFIKQLKLQQFITSSGESVVLNTRAAKPVVQEAYAKIRKIDIKGQI